MVFLSLGERRILGDTLFQHRQLCLVTVLRRLRTDIHPEHRLVAILMRALIVAFALIASANAFAGMPSSVVMRRPALSALHMCDSNKNKDADGMMQRVSLLLALSLHHYPRTSPASMWVTFLIYLSLSACVG